MIYRKPDEGPVAILLVEDNPDHAELVIRSLEDHPAVEKIFHLENGEEALDFLFQRGRFANSESYWRPQVVLLDLRLPKIDGLKVLEEIRTSDELDEIPVVILTTSNADRDVDKAYRRHVNSYLVKPTEYERFAKMMTDLGSYWLHWNQYPQPLDEGSTA